MNQMTPGVYWLGVLIGILIVGVLCGIIPLITAIIKKRVPLGVAGFISCLVGSSILGIILAAPIAIIFTLIIILKKTEEKSFQSPPEPPIFRN